MERRNILNSVFVNSIALNGELKVIVKVLQLNNFIIKKYTSKSPSKNTVILCTVQLKNDPTRVSSFEKCTIDLITECKKENLDCPKHSSINKYIFGDMDCNLPKHLHYLFAEILYW